MFRPLIASSLALALGASVAVADSSFAGVRAFPTVPNIPTSPSCSATTVSFCTSSNTSDQFNALGVTWQDTNGLFTPSYTPSGGNATTIENLHLNFTSGAGKDITGNGTNNDYTITINTEGGNRESVIKSDKGIQMGANGTGTMYADFQGNMQQYITLTLDLSNTTGATSFKGNIDINNLHQAKFNAFFGKNVEGNITVNAGGSYGIFDSNVANFVFLNGANLTGNININRRKTNFWFQNATVTGNISTSDAGYSEGLTTINGDNLTITGKASAHSKSKLVFNFKGQGNKLNSINLNVSTAEINLDPNSKLTLAGNALIAGGGGGTSILRVAGKAGELAMQELVMEYNDAHHQAFFDVNKLTIDKINLQAYKNTLDITAEQFAITQGIRTGASQSNRSINADLSFSGTGTIGKITGENNSFHLGGRYDTADTATLTLKPFARLTLTGGITGENSGSTLTISAQNASLSLGGSIDTIKAIINGENLNLARGIRLQSSASATLNFKGTSNIIGKIFNEQGGETSDSVVLASSGETLINLETGSKLTLAGNLAFDGGYNNKVTINGVDGELILKDIKTGYMPKVSRTLNLNVKSLTMDELTLDSGTQLNLTAQTFTFNKGIWVNSWRDANGAETVKYDLNFSGIGSIGKFGDTGNSIDSRGDVGQGIYHLNLNLKQGTELTIAGNINKKQAKNQVNFALDSATLNLKGVKNNIDTLTLNQGNNTINLAGENDPSLARNEFRLLKVGETAPKAGTGLTNGNNASLTFISYLQDPSTIAGAKLAGVDASVGSGTYGYAYTDRVLVFNAGDNSQALGGTYNAKFYIKTGLDLSKIQYTQGKGTEQAGNIAVLTIAQVNGASGTAKEKGIFKLGDKSIARSGLDFIQTTLTAVETDENGKVNADATQNKYVTYFVGDIKAINPDQPDQGGKPENPDQGGKPENPDQGGKPDNPDQGGNGNQGNDIQQQQKEINSIMEKISFSVIDLYLANFNSLNKRMGELRENNHSQGIWARVFNGQQSNDLGIQSSTNYVTAQAGYDYACGFEGANNFTGFAFSYSYSSGYKSKSTQNIGMGLNGFDTQLVELALYNSYVADSGWYNDSIAKASFMMNSITMKDGSENGVNNSKADFNSFAFSLSNEFGYRFLLGGNKEWFIDPQAELGAGYINGSKFALKASDGAKYADMTINSMINLRARLGSSFGYDFKNFTQDKDLKAKLYLGVFYEMDYFHFNDDGSMMKYQTTRNTTPYKVQSSNDLDHRAVLNVGTNLEVKNSTRIYFDFETSFAGKIKTDYKVNAGVRYSFGENANYKPINAVKKDAEAEKAPLKIEEKETKQEVKPAVEQEAQKAQAGSEAKKVEEKEVKAQEQGPKSEKKADAKAGKKQTKKQTAKKGTAKKQPAKKQAQAKKGSEAKKQVKKAEANKAKSANKTAQTEGKKDNGWGWW